MAEIIGIVFDFDDTLAPDTTSAFLAHWGVDPDEFWTGSVNPLLAEGWDPIPAYLYRMIELSRRRPPGERITDQKLREFGRKVRFQPGATAIFDKLIQSISESYPDTALEFYVVSSGIRRIIANTKISKRFHRIWASDFHCHPDTGEIVFPRNVVSFTDKTRFLFQISKGFAGPEYDSRPFEVNRRVSRESLRVPFSRMVYVGDGYTDVPCFALIRKGGGVALGVYDPGRREKWRRAWGFVEDERVSNLVPADYSKGGALEHSLIMAVDRIAGDIRREGRG
ncbi:MAG: haloacid dehalogenase-like hydrolase [Candidatus Glassbacteria bacterium]|nr:haloacid dehalogenase-like hydrolase [Candidatus Glassbacteria bacterium]